jgi:hypothetical protein
MVVLLVFPAAGATASWIALGMSDSAALWIVFATALAAGVRSSQRGAGRWSPVCAAGSAGVTFAFFLVIFVAAVALGSDSRDW